MRNFVRSCGTPLAKFWWHFLSAHQICMQSAAKERTKGHPLLVVWSSRTAWSSDNELDYKARGRRFESSPLICFCCRLFWHKKLCKSTVGYFFDSTRHASTINHQKVCNFATCLFWLMWPHRLCGQFREVWPDFTLCLFYSSCHSIARLLRAFVFIFWFTQAIDLVIERGHLDLSLPLKRKYFPPLKCKYFLWKNVHDFFYINCSWYALWSTMKFSRDFNEMNWQCWR